MRYRLVAARLRTELPSLEQLIARASTALERAARQPQDQDYFFAAAALDLHGFYAGLERMQYGLALPNGGVDPQTMAEFAALAEAGSTWWIEYVPPGDLDKMRACINLGPLRID